MNLRRVAFTGLFLATSASVAFADDEGQVLETPTFRITIIEHCEEGEVGCANVEYIGVNKKTGKTIRLKGTTYMVKCADGETPCHIGSYDFRNGEYLYSVYPNGHLEVTLDKKVVVSEDGKWQ